MATDWGSDTDLRRLLERVFLDVASRIDGQRLVSEAAVQDAAFASATHVLAVGKAALPMWRGLARPDLAGLLIAPADLVARAQASGGLPAPSRMLAADHPDPSERSVEAAREARRFVAAVAAEPGDGAARLLVLLSGGSSALLCAPASGLAWQDKRDAIAAVARAGATIRELNVVRKLLSAIKGGRLALATRAPIAVRALSDVVGSDPATIGSGPFSPDPSSFADAAAIVARLRAAVPAAVAAHLDRGARGAIADTPKPGTHELDHVDYRVLAGPARVVAEARAAAATAGCATGDLEFDVEDTVDDRAAAVLAVAHRALAATPARQPRARIFIGNGEPRVILPPPFTASGAPGATPALTRRGGRATHLALLVARGLAELPADLRPRVAFLAATGDTIRGPGTSNLLDLHLLVVV